ncbi:hypothetical protein [Aquisalimonas sp.]|uniref:hypothetical protein n=1 Tax=Aquisalimonas sp. TaxID=1872621 RepID=UPI0025B8E944|nr:hypothetical protein [Aquisalimonas sp.]
MRITSEEPQVLDTVRTILSLVDRRINDISEETMERLINVAPLTLPESHGQARLAQVRRNHQARQAFLDGYDVLDGRQVHEVTGNRASNIHATATRLRKQGRIFSVEINGELYYPGFQFDSNGRPRDVVREVLSIGGEEVSGWSMALWFASRHGYLGGYRPVELLDTDPERVTTAMKRDLLHPR